MLNKINSFFNSHFRKENLILSFDPLTFSPTTVYDKKEYFVQKNLNLELLDPSDSNDLVYVHYLNLRKKYDSLLFESSGFRHDLFVLSSRIMGREFSKTASMRSNDKPILFEVLRGKGYFIIEKNERINIIEIGAGNRVLISAGELFTIVNSSNENSFVCSALMDSGSEIETCQLKASGGSKLFYTKKGFVKNKNVSPTYVLEDHKGDFIGDFSFDKPVIYKQFVYLPEKFNFLKE